MAGKNLEFSNDKGSVKIRYEDNMAMVNLAKNRGDDPVECSSFLFFDEVNAVVLFRALKAYLED